MLSGNWRLPPASRIWHLVFSIPVTAVLVSDALYLSVGGTLLCEFQLAQEDAQDAFGAAVAASIQNLEVSLP